MNLQIKKSFYLFSVLGFGFLAAQTAKSEVNLLDKDGWKFGIGGFVEMDTILDSTRSFVETVGNGPVARSGTYNGENGRTQFSMRNSRLFFNVLPPVQDDWKTRGYLEMDFLGFDPQSQSNTSGLGSTDASFLTNPTFRLRHAFLTAENDGYTILVGQTWSLFGWQPQYVLASVSVNPVSGSLYQRTPRATVIKAFERGQNTYQLGLGFERPTQQDSRIPNLNAGVRWSLNSRKSAFTSVNGDVKNQPMSFGLSGTFREFAIPRGDGMLASKVNLPGSALALDALIPVIEADDDKHTGNTLSLLAEGSVGKGYGDEFPSWTGGSGQLLNGAGSNPNIPNVDSGIGGLDTGGTFQLIHLQTLNFQLQYHLPENWRSFMTLGYSQLYSNNIGNLSGSTTALYDRATSKFLNYLHDFTNQIRVGVEFAQFTTHYLDDLKVHDNRVQVATYFRF